MDYPTRTGGNYSAQNGQYYGAYQLSLAYLNGDLSASNQDTVANQYVASRYGSWARRRLLATKRVTNGYSRLDPTTGPFDLN